MRLAHSFALCTLSLANLVGCGAPDSTLDDDSVTQATDDALLIASAGSLRATPEKLIIGAPARLPTCVETRELYKPGVGSGVSGAYLGSVFDHYETYTPGNTAPGSIYGYHVAAIWRSASAAEAGDFSSGLMTAAVCDHRPTGKIY